MRTFLSKVSSGFAKIRVPSAQFNLYFLQGNGCGCSWWYLICLWEHCVQLRESRARWATAVIDPTLSPCTGCSCGDSFLSGTYLERFWILFCALFMIQQPIGMRAQCPWRRRTGSVQSCQPGPGQGCLCLETRGLAQVANSNRHRSGFQPQEVTSMPGWYQRRRQTGASGLHLCLASKACLLPCCEASAGEEHTDTVQAHRESLLAGWRLYWMFGSQVQSLSFLRVSF